MSKYVLIVAVVSFLVLVTATKAADIETPTLLCEPVKSQAFVTQKARMMGAFYVERAPLLDTFCKK